MQDILNKTLVQRNEKEIEMIMRTCFYEKLMLELASSEQTCKEPRFFNSVFPRLLTHQHLHTLLWRDAADEEMGDPTNEVSVDLHMTQSGVVPLPLPPQESANDYPAIKTPVIQIQEH